MSSASVDDSDLEQALSKFDALNAPAPIPVVPNPQQPVHGQLFLLTNECARYGMLYGIQHEIDRMVKVLGKRSIIQVRRGTLGELKEALNKHAKSIVAAHLSGHGSQGFALHTGCMSDLHVPDPESFAEMFAACSRMRCVFINACSCKDAAYSFLRCCPGVNYVIYFDHRIADSAAPDFASGFYQELAKTSIVEIAFGEALALLGLYPPAYYDERFPMLEIRKKTRPPICVGPPRKPLLFVVELNMPLVATAATPSRDHYRIDVTRTIIEELKRRVDLEVREEDVKVEKWETRWKLRVDNSLDIRSTKAQAKALLRALKRTYRNDAVDIFMDSFDLGSLILCLRSPAQTFHQLRELHASGGLSPLLGMPVLSLTEMGVHAVIAAPGYVFTRLCAYQTACIGREPEPAMRVLLPQRARVTQVLLEPEGARDRARRGAASSSAAQDDQAEVSASQSSDMPSGSDALGTAAGKRPQVEPAVEQRPQRIRVMAEAHGVPSSFDRVHKELSDRARTAGLSDATRDLLAQLHKGVKELVVYGKKLEPHEIFALAEALKVNTSLKTLDVARNILGPGDMVLLAEALKVNTSLTSLDVRYNKLGPDDCIALAKALKVNTSLATLNVGGSPLLTRGIAALAEAFEVNTSLTALNVASSQLGPDDCIALAEALKVNTSLTHLDLRYNKLGPEDGIALAEALKVNTSLTSLDLGYNRLGHGGLAALAEALKVNKSLTSLNAASKRLRSFTGIEGCLERNREAASTSRA